MSERDSQSRLAVVQRFGGALNLNVHVHALVIDGVCARDGAGVSFWPAPVLHDLDVALGALSPAEGHATPGAGAVPRRRSGRPEQSRRAPLFAPGDIAEDSDVSAFVPCH